jgi:hypothetical protein
MIAPEVFLVLGSTMVVGSLFALAAARHARSWFFPPDLRAQLQPVEARAQNEQGREVSLAAGRRTRIA